MAQLKSVPPPAPDGSVQEIAPGSATRATRPPLAGCALKKAGPRSLTQGAQRTPIAVLALDVDGVLTDGRVSLGDSGSASKGLLFRDLDAITSAKSAGFRIALVTGESGALVDVVASHVGPECVLSGKKDKHAALHELADRMGVPIESICFVGDADRDAAAFGCVGLALCPKDASSRALRSAHVVLDKNGGAGAVAEAVSLLLHGKEDRERGALLQRDFRRIAEDSLSAHRRFIDEAPPVLAAVATTFIRAIRNGNKILFCGNGGSAADAQHVAGELMGRFLIERAPWPAIALTTDTSILTAIGNDWTFEDVFARQVRALARPGDVIVGISTSGKSPNVLRALDDGAARGAVRVGFTGERGAPFLAPHTDVCFAAPAASTPRVQELHILAWHSICETVEVALTSSPH
jgi:D-sedoheptulose 7-phosphate isomerase